MKKTALLALENGVIFQGYGFGDLESESQGEVVFNTAMTGYQEIMTDPSYHGQIMTFTYPHIGNYGVNDEDNESDSIHAEGMIVKEYSAHYSNFRAHKSLGLWLQENNKLGIEGVDTRMLVRILRTEGAMRGIISTKELNPMVLVGRAKSLDSMEGLDLSGKVTCSKKYTWSSHPEHFTLPEMHQKKRYKVAALDYGIKRNILRRLSDYGCDVTIFPAHTSAEEVLEFQPDGIFLSNGPGDPAATKHAIDTIKKLHDKKPIFGICLGHQLLALAFGAKTYKLKFGHRGANHPVKNLLTNSIEISSQNHGFAVDITSLPDELEPTHINLNDNTLSGIRHRDLPIFSVQYHPESSPGPHDSDYLFKQFIDMMEIN
ncbi:MAG: glutamine-hydrolyzing carbamoyl-phosphate synthase small subunit [Ignavibacteria bacterium]|nr:glutamine-hydrolyzing carbamoyl-phosphate synthase small subunit [Ignavibacteria bacterium]